MGGAGGIWQRAVRRALVRRHQDRRAGWEFAVIDGLTEVLDRSPGIRIVAEFQPGILRSQHRVPAERPDVLPRQRLPRALPGRRTGWPSGRDAQIVELCDAAGRVGSVILLLER